MKSKKERIIIGLVLICLISVGGVLGATIPWNGDGSTTNWNDGDNSINHLNLIKKYINV